MLTVWNKDIRNEMNHSLCFLYKNDGLKEGKNTLSLVSTGIYRLFVDGKLYGYGPARAAHGFVRRDEYKLPENFEYIAVEVYANNCNSYYLLDEKPYFGAEIYEDGKIKADINSFKAYLLNDRIKNVHRASFQRCFTESYIMEKDRSFFYKGDISLFPEITFSEVPHGTILERNVSYPKLDFTEAIDNFEDGEIEIHPELIPENKPRSLREAEENPTFKAYKYNDLTECLFDEITSITYKKTEKKDTLQNAYKSYDMKRAHCGFFRLKCNVLKECDVYILSDELCFDGESHTIINCERNDLTSALKYHLKEGEYDLISFEAYVGRYLRVIAKDGEIEINSFGIISYENPDADNFKYKTGKDALDEIITAAKYTFAHNALDVLTDCPSRERAGWLCDSYFTSVAEKFFTGENKVEKNFLENIILSPQIKELPEGMLPMCYPADHPNGNHIPNWALWFILELENYLERTGDRELIEKAKNRVDGVLNCFKQNENEYKLLEDLKGWVFVEWSPCNDESHIAGVNFPSNMLYMAALKAAGKLYNNEEYIKKSEIIKENVIKFGFNGEFFTDNSLRINGKLERTNNLTETCQYYAMFFGILTKEAYPELWDKMIEKFGPERDLDKVYPEISKSNAFIGNYLRLETLLKHGYKKEVLDNCESYFINMARKTGTLWEHMQDGASLDHGFASVVAYYIYKCLNE